MFIVWRTNGTGSSRTFWTIRSRWWLLFSAVDKHGSSAGGREPNEGSKCRPHPIWTSGTESVESSKLLARVVSGSLVEPPAGVFSVVQQELARRELVPVHGFVLPHLLHQFVCAKGVHEAEGTWKNRKHGDPAAAESWFSVSGSPEFSLNPNNSRFVLICKRLTLECFCYLHVFLRFTTSYVWFLPDAPQTSERLHIHSFTQNPRIPHSSM